MNERCCYPNKVLYLIPVFISVFYTVRSVWLLLVSGRGDDGDDGGRGDGGDDGGRGDDGDGGGRGDDVMMVVGVVVVVKVMGAVVDTVV